jgi:hypothetical protein
MSDEITRNEAGQFAAAPEPFPTITEQREEALGYVPATGLPADKPAEPAPFITANDTDDGLKPFVENEPEPVGTPESEIRTYGDSFLQDLAPNETLTLEQASEITTLEKKAEAEVLEAARLAEIREAVDEKRVQEAVKSLGPETQALIADGLDPDVAQALQKPQVREALESEFAKADQVRQQHTAALTHAQQFAQAAFFEAVPELSGLPLDQVEAGLQLLQQVEPARFDAAMRTLSRVGQIAQQQAAIQQQQQAIAQQQFVEHVKAEDARLIEMRGGEKAADEVTQALFTYLDDHGVPKQQRLNMIMNNPVLRTAEARETIWKAAKYDEIRKAAPKAAPKSLPPVSRPGTSNVVRSSDPSSKIQALEKQLATASGDKAARISAQIWGLQKQARG